MRRDSEVVGHHQAHVARRLPARTRGKSRPNLTGLCLVTLADIDDFLLVQQVEDREQQQRFIAYLEQAGKKVLAEKQQIALDNRESELEDSYGSVQYQEKWLKLQERSLDRLWKDFLEVVIQREIRVKPCSVTIKIKRE